MTDNGDLERHSVAQSAELISDPEERARRESRNVLAQFDTAIEAIDFWLSEKQREFKLRPSFILDLHRKALAGIDPFAGNYRPSSVKIHGSTHEPVGAHLVPGLLEELCDYVNDNWQKSPIHLAAYVMWRINWIHPFTDGNGRTARTLSYVVLCIRLGHRVPGDRTIPVQISSNKTPYYNALGAADREWKEEQLDLSKLEELLSALLATQLHDLHKQATESQS